MCLVDKYISLYPPVGKIKEANIYLHSLEKINPAQQYGVQAVSKNSISKVVKYLLKSVNSDSYFANYSHRITSVTRVFQAGVGGKIVHQITGHVSDALKTKAKIKLEIEFSD